MKADGEHAEGEAREILELAERLEQARVACTRPARTGAVWVRGRGREEEQKGEGGGGADEGRANVRQVAHEMMRVRGECDEMSVHCVHCVTLRYLFGLGIVLRATWLRARTITDFRQLLFVRLQEAGAHHAEMNTMRDELRQLRIENSRLRRENEKGLAAGGVKAPSGSRQGPASPAPRDLAENAPAATPRDDDELNSAVIRTIALKQLKEVIEQIYASKDKYDAKCAESHLPRETLEQHMYTFLNQVCSRMPWPLRPLLRTRIHPTCLGSDRMTRILYDTSPDAWLCLPPPPPPRNEMRRRLQYPALMRARAEQCSVTDCAN